VDFHKLDYWLMNSSQNASTNTGNIKVNWYQDYY